MKKKISFFLTIFSILFLVSSVGLSYDLYTEESIKVGEMMYLQSGDFVSGAEITSKNPCIISSGVNVNLTAAGTITLGPGFQAAEGSSFAAKAGYAYDSDSDGLAMSEMMALQMKKIEELTLYAIELKKENKTLKKSFEDRLTAIEAAMKN